jgi:hypothetical protein
VATSHKSGRVPALANAVATGGRNTMGAAIQIQRRVMIDACMIDDQTSQSKPIEKNNHDTPPYFFLFCSMILEK